MPYMITQSPIGQNSIHIWTSGEVDETELERLIRYYRGLGSSVVVYRSGRGDLTSLTSDLLAANCLPRSKNMGRADRER